MNYPTTNTTPRVGDLVLTGAGTPAASIGIGVDAPTVPLHVRGFPTVNLPSPATGVINTAAVLCTAHALVVNDAVRLPGGTGGAYEVYRVTAVTDANNFTVDRNFAAGFTSQTGQRDRDVLLQIDNAAAVVELQVTRRGNVTVNGDLQVNAWAITGMGGATPPWDLQNDCAILNDPTDSVGIGTSTPEQKIHAMRAANPCILRLDTYRASADANYPSVAQLFRSGSSTLGTKLATADGNSLGTIQFAGVNAGGSNWAQAAAIVVKQVGGAGTSSNPASMDLQTSDGTAPPASRLFIAPSGRVGVGTTGPAEKLSITDTNTTLSIGDGKGNASEWNPQIKSAGAMLLGMDSEVAGGRFIRIAPDDHRIWVQGFEAQSGNPIAAALTLAAGLNRGIEIDTTGKVGVATASPGATLDVNGHMRALSYSPGWPTSGKGVEVLYHSGDDRGIVVSYDRTATAFKRLDVQGNPLVLNYGGIGNVGIGTASPTKARLVTDGQVGNTSAIFGVSTTGVSLIASWPAVMMNSYWNGGARSLAAGFCGSFWLCPTDGRFEWRTSTQATAADQSVTETARMVILNNGNVGVGTTSPGEKLEVNGNVKIGSGGYNNGHLRLGNYHLWVDSTGDLRIKSSAPTSDTDGTVVGTQS